MRLTDAQRTEALSHLASCPDCGTILMNHNPHSHLHFEVRPKEHELVIELLGLRAYLAQGVGAVGVGYHRCPPTFAEMTPVVRRRPRRVESEVAP